MSDIKGLISLITKPSNLKAVMRHYRFSTNILEQLLKRRISAEESAEIIKKNMAMREKNFLKMIKRCIFENEKSPYKALLDRAGYTYEGVEKLVGEKGLEGALKKLYEDGVYIDIQEFKGKKPTVRGQKTFNFKESDFNNHLLSEGIDTQTGGSRGRSTQIRVPMEFILHNAVYGIYASTLYGIPGKKVIIWLPILPALEGLFFNLRFGIAGNTPVKWYSHVDPSAISPSFMDRLRINLTVRLARRNGINLPSPEFVNMLKAVEIARWMDENKKGSQGFVVVTYATSALRLAVEAKKAGIRLDGTIFWLMGEPLTPKKQQVIEDCGGKVFSIYGCNELMLIGHACENPMYPDDMHFFKDKLGLIQRKRKLSDYESEVDAFMFTTILDISPKIFLNTELGDYGVVEERKCGCRFEELGLTEHISQIRSFEKLTAEGVTFIGSNIIPLVEETLPATFGGSATDYQFIEEEDEEGTSKLFALISPDIGEIDEEKFKELTYTALSGSRESQRGSKSMWDQAGTLQIRRTNPIPTKRGKILPFYIRKGLTPAAVSEKAQGAGAGGQR